MPQSKSRSIRPSGQAPEDQLHYRSEAQVSQGQKFKQGRIIAVNVVCAERHIALTNQPGFDITAQFHMFSDCLIGVLAPVGREIKIRGLWGASGKLFQLSTPGEV
jgi:hypothetical protein